MQNVWSYCVGLTLTICLLLNGCGKAPKVEHCIISEKDLQCIDPRLDKEHVEYRKTYLAAINYLCTNADDYMSTQEFCQRRACGRLPAIERCIISEDHLICLDPRISNDGYTKTFKMSANYLCIGPTDFYTMREWCLRKGACRQ